MLTLTRNQRKMLSVFLYESFRTLQQMSKMDAAQESASTVGAKKKFRTDTKRTVQVRHTSRKELRTFRNEHIQLGIVLPYFHLSSVVL